MRLRVVWIAPKSRSKEPAYDSLTREYVSRISKYQSVEASDVASESLLLKLLKQSAGRTKPLLVLLDSRGKEMTSEQVAEFIEAQHSADVQQLIFAIGPGTFALECNRISSYFADIRTLCGLDVERVLLGDDAVDYPVTHDAPANLG